MASLIEKQTVAIRDVEVRRGAVGRSVAVHVHVKRAEFEANHDGENGFVERRGVVGRNIFDVHKQRIPQFEQIPSCLVEGDVRIREPGPTNQKIDLESAFLDSKKSTSPLINDELP